MLEDIKELLNLLGVITCDYVLFCFKFPSELFTVEFICCLEFSLKYSSWQSMGEVTVETISKMLRIVETGKWMLRDSLCSFL